MVSKELCMNAHDNRSLPVRFATHLHCAPYSMSCDLAVVCCTVCCTRRANQYRLCSTQRALGGTPSSTQRVKHSVPADLNLLQLCALTGTVYVYVHYTYTVPVGTWSSVYLHSGGGCSACLGLRGLLLLLLAGKH
jgi:hypothetical protein